MRKLILTSLIAFGLLFGTLPTVSATPNNYGTLTVPLVYHPMQRYFDPRIQKQEAGPLGMLYIANCVNGGEAVWETYIAETGNGPGLYWVFLGVMPC